MNNNISDASNEKGVRLSGVIESYSTRASVVKLSINILEEIIKLKNSGIYHSVLTPADVYVYPSGNVKIQPMAQRATEKANEFTRLAQLYTAPEAYDGAFAEVSVIYSVGTIMYKLLNGGLEPFRQTMDFDSAANAYKLRMSGTRLTAPSNADALLSGIVLKACEFNVSRRYLYPEDMLEELKLLADGNYQRKVRQEPQPEPLESAKKKCPWKLIFTAILSGALCVAIVAFGANYVVRNIYIKAERYMRDGKLDKAREVFSEIEWYKGTQKMLMECDYRQAEQLAENGDIDSAIKIFKELSDKGYENIGEKLNDTLLEKANKLNESGNKEDAMKILLSLAADSNSDAEEIINDSKSEDAARLYKEGNFAEARELYASIGDGEMVDECDYRLALGSMENGNYTNAMAIFIALDGYGESDKNFALCEEWLISENKKNNVFSSASGNLGRYSNSDGFYVEYSMKDDKLTSSYTLPYERGKYFKVEDGIHYNSKSGNSWERQWIYEYVSSSMINVYNYIDNCVYTLEKE